MASFVRQGPSLLAYNDAVFTEDDWKGIIMLNDSVKRGKPLKVGKFGLGFKSVFHMTGEFLFLYALITVHFLFLISNIQFFLFNLEWSPSQNDCST